MNKELIQVGSKIYSFPRLPHETEQVYSARKNFFIVFFTTIPNKTEKKYCEAFRLSMVFANVYFLGCVYSDKIMKKISEVMKLV
jgi:hypothetical protein